MQSQSPGRQVRGSARRTGTSKPDFTQEVDRAERRCFAVSAVKYNTALVWAGSGDGGDMLASFAAVPMGLEGGVKHQVAEALAIVDASGLAYKLGAMNTTIEGEPDEVMEVILRCHRRMLELAPRVLTSIAIDERKGVAGRIIGKVKDVEEVLGKKLERG